MDSKKKATRALRKRAIVYFILWFVLILAGIFEKRMLGNPDYVVFYHLPAAFFLVLGLYDLSAPFRRRNRVKRIEFERSHQF